MKLKLMLTVILTLSCLAVSAQTKINDNGKISVTLSINDSSTLFNLLEIEEIRGRSGFLKTYSSSDAVITINCTKSEFSDVRSPICSIKIDYDRANDEYQDSHTKLFRGDDELVAELDTIDSKALYESLSAIESNNEKYFRSEDKKASIRCIKVATRGRTIYQCYVQTYVR